MEDTEALISIGAFARHVGLTPSALRFYDDCGVLRPARVDAATGYRFYAPSQQARATLVRTLREADLPLAEVSVVLDGPPARAREILMEHLRRGREAAEAARTAIEGVLRTLPPTDGAGEGGGGLAVPRPDDAPPARVRLGGAELASAVRQVAPAAAGGAAGARFPVLRHVLVEWDGQEVRLAATDRYRLSVRALRPLAVDGAPGRALVDVAHLRAVAAWASRLPELTIEVGDAAAAPGGDQGADGDADLDEDGDANEGVSTAGAADDTGAARRIVRFTGADGSCRTAPVQGGEFPDYRTVLEHLTPRRSRILVDRGALRGALADRAATDRVGLEAGADELRLTVADGGTGTRARTEAEAEAEVEPEDASAVTPTRTTVLRAVCAGPPTRLWFASGVLLPALEASVGPDVLLEIAAPGEPVVVRSADQGGFTTLVMPQLAARS
ncbi:MerR family transcriptional regulator [Allostreptomyces psammosilenae]|uniref:DNA-binding transcriptional MerR regulator n=1 Tax=Allostreptomyces psammosilenae TaxID=1892865 RepID=A0A853A7U9_9ACTN|nr:MerR family transcriptional regulator [Allostreptomyces psammosilenae]NYI06731.1 DNA-binding transcriptional MerR regulator [Allostreptomyces psammosilenae]